MAMVSVYAANARSVCDKFLSVFMTYLESAENQPNIRRIMSRRKSAGKNSAGRNWPKIRRKIVLKNSAEGSSYSICPIIINFILCRSRHVPAYIVLFGV